MESPPSTNSSLTQRNKKIRQLRNSIRNTPALKKMSESLEEKMVQQKLKMQLFAKTSKQQSVSDSHRSNEIAQYLLQKSDDFSQNYKLLEKIGEGCNATVYKAQYNKTQKIYAVKKIKIEPEIILNMKRDFITLKQLNHPSICHYKALYILKEIRTAYLVQEYVPYPSLNEVKVQDEEELRTIVKAILEALDYLHSRNICHRDIKPENILYDQENKRIKLIDFGISKKTFLRGQRRDMLTVIGSNLYMAPQILSGGGYDERVDLWSLGVTIFKLVTGATPFQSEYQTQTVAAIEKILFKFETQKWSYYSSNLKDLVSQLLKKADGRISIEQAQRHIWFQQSPRRQIKKRRTSSLDMKENQVFQGQVKSRLVFSMAKEEGSKTHNTRLLKKIKELKKDVYDLEDSDDENSIVTPKSAIFLTTNSDMSFSTCNDNLFLGMEG